ncbi:MAG: 4-vinyl reductase [Anaerolineae bacterium]|nr:4-vinyl reductase [Anaerolineae bacterium]
MEERRIPNLLLHVVFQQVSDLMGEKSLAMLLRQSSLSTYIDNPPSADESPAITVQEYSSLLAQIYELFGPRGSRAIFAQGGRKGGQELRRLHPTRYNLAGAALKLLPENKRIELILQKVEEEGTALYGNPHHLREEDDAFYMEIHACPYCAEIARRAREGGPDVSHPVCHIATAVYQEMVEWGTGHSHPVQETACIALGDPVCVFRVAK